MFFYENIFKDTDVETIQKKLELLLNTNDYILISDNFSIIIDGDSNISTFPSFFELIKKTVFNRIHRTFNSCLIYKNGGDVFELIDNNTDICILYFGTPELKFGEITIPHNSIYIAKKTNVGMINPDNCWICVFLDVKKNISSTERPTTTIKTEYHNHSFRMQNGLAIRKTLCDIHYTFKDTLKSEDILKFIKIKKILGTGDWGNVFSGIVRDIDQPQKNSKLHCAVKLSRIKPEDLTDLYSKKSNSWYETNMLQNILKKAVEQKWCQNIPYLIDTFVCPEYTLELKKTKEVHPCVVLITELASGDLKDWFTDSNISEIPDPEIYSALFQIMAGIHCMQMVGQITHNDIKTKNILYFNIAPGGYWLYTIQGVHFYVPNYGKMFIINDFGVGNIYSPYHVMFPNNIKKSFNLGSRLALNINNNFSPLVISENVDENVEWIEDDKIVSASGLGFFLFKNQTFLTSKLNLTESQSDYLKKNNYSLDPKTKNFYNPYVLPPFEFFNDTQDALRMFTGGKRTVQRGSHSSSKKISSKLKDSLNLYSSSTENSKAMKFGFDTHHVLAGSFILKFFSEHVNFTKKIQGTYKIDSFLIKKY